MSKKRVLFSLAALSCISLHAVDTATGSGCAISDEYVLTAYHVVDDAEKIVVSFGSSTAMKATVYKKNVIDDWAVLKLDGKAPAHVICEENEVALGQKIYTLGFPSSSLLGEDIKYADGVISALSGMKSNKSAFQFSVPIQPGNSGGPLFNEMGRAVGIVQSTMNPEAFYKATGGALPQNVNFGFPIAKLRSHIGDLISVSNAKISVADNQAATCLIKVSLCERRRSPDLVSGTKVLPTQKERTYDVSKRYMQLSNYLDDIANGVFRRSDGSVVDVRTQDGFAEMDTILQLTREYMCMEIEKSCTGYTQDWFRAKTARMVRQARGRMATAYNDANENAAQENMSFFGLKLGDIITTGATLCNEWGCYSCQAKLNGQVASAFEIEPECKIDGIGKKEKERKIRECTFYDYKIWLKKPVLGMQRLHVYTLRTGEIFGIKFEAHDPPVEMGSLIVAYEKKLGLKFSSIKKMDMEAIAAFQESGNYHYGRKVYDGDNFLSVETTNWSVDVAFSSSDDAILLITRTGYYARLQDEERREREKKARERIDAQTINIDGL